MGEGPLAEFWPFAASGPGVWTWEVPMTLAVIVVLALGGFATWVAYQDEKKGAAILVGVAVIGLLYVVLGRELTADDVQVPTTHQGPAGTPSTPGNALSGH